MSTAQAGVLPLTGEAFGHLIYTLLPYLFGLRDLGEADRLVKELIKIEVVAR